MQMDFKKNTLCMALCMVFAGHAYAVDTNHNPASIGYVNEEIITALKKTAYAIEEVYQRTIYTPGTAIGIVNHEISGAYTAGSGILINGAVISATGFITPYTGTGAIYVDPNTKLISSVFAGSNGVEVDNATATIKGNYTGSNGVSVTGSSIAGAYTGTNGVSVTGSSIAGAYTGGTGISISGPVISATGLITPYTGTGAILVDSGTNVISSAFVGSNGVSVSNSGATIQGNYTGTNGVEVSGASITGAYVAGTGIDITTTAGTSTISAKPRVKVGDVGNGLGGVVVYVSNPDSDGYGTSGLVMSMKALSQGTGTTPTLMVFSNVARNYSWGNGVGSGAMNTANLVANDAADNVDAPSNAPFAAAAYLIEPDGVTTAGCPPPPSGSSTVPPPSVICIGGWYLPSMAELQLIINNKGTNNFETIKTGITNGGGEELKTDVSYWSSTSIAFNAGQGGYTVDLATGDAKNENIGTLGYARAFRQF